MINQDTSTEFLATLQRMAAAVEQVAKAVQPAKQVKQVPEDHPLSDLSKEEIAIILVFRGETSLKVIAEKVGCQYQSVRNMTKLRKARQHVIAQQRMSAPRRGFNDGNGEVDGYD